MTKKIDKKIVGYKVVGKEELDAREKPVENTESQSDTGSGTTMTALFEPEEMHEALKRPEVLFGTTYKIKTPQSEHALYITINDMVLNQGTEFEERHPYEIFINSKNMENFQWVLALTRLVSAVWRKGGDTCFLVDELKNVFDPRGGYLKRGGTYIPSLVAEIGYVIESHLKSIGVLKGHELDASQKEFLEAKRREFLVAAKQDEVSTGFPEQATLCGKCNVKAMIIMDGCQTCLNCGESKCG